MNGADTELFIRGILLGMFVGIAIGGLFAHWLMFECKYGRKSGK